MCGYAKNRKEENQLKFKLSSGREVEINRPSVRDKMRIGDMSGFVFEVTGYDENGKPKMGEGRQRNPVSASYEWAAAGLGVELDALDEYSGVEIREIGLKVQELAELSPTKEPN